MVRVRVSAHHSDQAEDAADARAGLERLRHAGEVVHLVGVRVRVRLRVRLRLRLRLRLRRRLRLRLRVRLSWATA